MTKLNITLLKDTKLQNKFWGDTLPHISIFYDTCNSIPRLLQSSIAGDTGDLKKHKVKRTNRYSKESDSGNNWTIDLP